MYMIFFWIRLLIDLCEAAGNPTVRIIEHEWDAPNGYFAVPLEKDSKTNLLWFKARVLNKPIYLFIDTGATNSSISLDAAQKLMLPLMAGKTDIVKGVDFDGLKMDRTKLPPLKLGAVTLNENIFGVLHYDFANSGELHSDKELHGVIGANVLQVFRARIGYSNNILYLEDSPKYDKSRMQGEWRLAKLVDNGVEQTDPKVLAQYSLRVTDSKWEARMPDGLHRGSLGLSQDDTVRYFGLSDYTVNGKPPTRQQAGAVVPPFSHLGPYRVSWDRFTYAQPGTGHAAFYPTKLHSTPINKTAVYTWVR